MIITVLAPSISFQILAVFFALRMISLTGKSANWLALAGAIALMAVRRGIALSHALRGTPDLQPDLSAELVALAISCLMAGGPYAIAPLFRSSQRAQTTVSRANRALRVLSRTNQAVTRASDVRGLLQDVCDLLVTTGGFRMVWVGLTEGEAGGAVEPLTYAGHSPIACCPLAQSVRYGLADSGSCARWPPYQPSPHI